MAREDLPAAVHRAARCRLIISSMVLFYQRWCQLQAPSRYIGYCFRVPWPQGSHVAACCADGNHGLGLVYQ